ncbi:MAG: tetratricopeptide repeat protein [Chloroflexi bacterium]|nr:tetratricopeptide repeat protein [Chloroflexota bacterium]
MIICSNPACQSQNPDGSHYCGKCGTHLPLSQSGPFREATQFCRACGTRRERFPTDRRMCTVLFADVHGFTAMSEILNDVEKVTQVMNMVFTRLTEKIVDLGGSIDKYAGDNIMARFGAPEAHEDDPERAVRASLEMQAELRKISGELQTTYGFGLDMRIGLNTGEVNAAEVGGEVRGISYKTYTIMGDVVNLASRLEHESRVGHVLVGELTYKLSGHAFDFIDLGYKQIRGKREPVRCYEVVGPKREREKRRGLAGRDLPLIGRDEELYLLWERLQNVLEGHGQVASVVGEAGVGKSSLLREFERRLRAYDPDIWYWDGAAFSYSSGQYFSLVRTLIFKYCKISDNEDEAGIRQKLLAAIRDLLGEVNDPDGAEFGENAALLGQVAGLVLPNRFIDGLDPQKRNTLLVEAVTDFILSKAERNPLVLVLDDLHWGDSNSLKVIDRIITRILTGAGSEVFLLLLYRPDFAHTWPVVAQGGDNFEYILLDRLQPEQMEPLVRQFLEEWLKVQEPERVRKPEGEWAPVPAPLMQIIERAGGNAFFSEEILKRLLEDGYIVPDDLQESGWRVVKDLTSFRPPETLQEVLLARVDNLALFDRRVLQVASVVGNRFEKRILTALDEFRHEEAEVGQAINNLEVKDLITSKRTEGADVEYVFRHYLTREVAYNNLLGVERSKYHGEVAQVIERFKADRLHDYTVLDDLAYHYEHSDFEEKAVHYLILAGDMRRSLFRNDEALRAYYQAQEILLGPEFKDQPDTAARLVQIDTNIGDILSLKEAYQEAITHYQAALDRCDDPMSRVAIGAKLIGSLVKLGSYEQGLKAFEDAQAEFARQPDGSFEEDPKAQHLRAKLLNEIGWIYYLQGRYEEAETTYKDSLALLEKADQSNRELQIDQGRAYSGLANVYVDRGEFDLSEECLQKAALLQQQTSKLDALGRTYNLLGLIAVLRGDLVKGDNYWKLARENAQRAGDLELASGILGNLGALAVRQGRLELAIRYFHSTENSPNPTHIASSQINLAQVLLQQGDFNGALAELQKAINLAVSIGSMAQVVEAYTTMGWLYLANRNWQEAERWLNEALARSQELNNLERAATARLFRFELFLEQSSLERAGHEQGAATRLVRELGDPLLVGQLERLNGRLAYLQGDFGIAGRTFEASLENLEPIKAFLEMSYTKLYYARCLLSAYHQSQDHNQLERARGLLMQAASTFDACGVVLKKEEAEAALRDLGEPVAVYSTSAR